MNTMIILRGGPRSGETFEADGPLPQWFGNEKYGWYTYSNTRSIRDNQYTYVFRPARPLSRDEQVDELRRRHADANSTIGACRVLEVRDEHRGREDSVASIVTGAPKFQPLAPWHDIGAAKMASLGFTRSLGAPRGMFIRLPCMHEGLRLPPVEEPREVSALAVLYKMVVHGIKPVDGLFHGFLLIDGRIWCAERKTYLGGSKLVVVEGMFREIQHLEPSMMY